MIQAILSLLLGLPPHISDRDELPQDRHDRLTVVAQDIATASRGSLQVASALITLGSVEVLIRGNNLTRSSLFHTQILNEPLNFKISN